MNGRECSKALLAKDTDNTSQGHCQYKLGKTEYTEDAQQVGRTTDGCLSNALTSGREKLFRRENCPLGSWQ